MYTTRKKRLTHFTTPASVFHSVGYNADLRVLQNRTLQFKIRRHFVTAQNLSGKLLQAFRLYNATHTTILILKKSYSNISINSKANRIDIPEIQNLKNSFCLIYFKDKQTIINYYMNKSFNNYDTYN
jgi:hypothetical protein